MSFLNENGLIYELNNENHTATIIKSDQTLQGVTIPRSVNYESEEYIITAIGQFSFAYHPNIQVVTFSDDSEVELIGKGAFVNSSLLSISIPPSVTKVDKKSFYSCEDLFMAKFTEDSKLEIIGPEAFSCCGFKSFYLPPNVTEIGDCSFEACSNLLVFTIPENSKLITIGKGAFAWTPIVSLYFPQNLKNLCEEWSCSMTCLKSIQVSPSNRNFKSINDDTMVVGKSDPNSDLYDSLVFITRKIKILIIPSFIKYINTTAVSSCEQLEFVEFEKESNLISIEKGAFSYSSLLVIKFPSSLIQIKDNAFARCESLQKVDFENDSKIKSIGKHAFSFTFVSSFSFPALIDDFKKEWCFYMSCLCHISISPKNKNLSYYDSKIIIGKSNPNKDVYDTLIFARRDIDQIKIPSFIKIIKSCAFFDCIYLQKVEFTEDSELELIESYAFSGSALIEFTVPKHVKVIEKNVFDRCKLLESIKFHDDSELIKIGKYALNSESLTSISIPKNVQIIKNGFNSMSSILTNVSISPENKNFKIYNGNMVVGKSNLKNDFFDDLLFVNGDKNYIKIPSFIKHIKNFTFIYFISLEKVDFEENSQLESIDFAAFGHTSIKSVIFPSSVKSLAKIAFGNCLNLTSIEFLGDDVSIDSMCFFRCSNFSVLSFPNATKINIAYDAFQHHVCSIFVCPYVEIIQFISQND